MEPDIKAILSKKDLPPNIQSLMADIRGMLKHSRRVMKDHFATWDENMRVFKTIRRPDNEDNNAAKNAEPTKMVVPMSYAQVMTFVTYAFMLMKQGETFFELDANKNETYGLVECSEDFLERDLRYNRFDSILVQALLDISRFGLCALKTAWSKETTFVNVTQPGTSFDTGMGWNMATGPYTVSKEVVKYEGNKIINVSPYRLLPDLRLPLTRWREGRFVADEMEFNIAYLKELETQGVVAGVDFITKTSKTLFNEPNVNSGWDETRFSMINDWLAADNSTGSSNEGKAKDWMCISTEGHFKIIPSKYRLGPENYPCDYLIQLINDQRPIRIERINYMHREFIYDIGQFIPDVHSRLNMALVDPISAIQDVISFLINSRVISIRQGIEKHVVYDPSVVETAALQQRSPYIPLKKGAPKSGVSNFLMQLKYVDPTTMNMQEADSFSKILQTVTGCNENAMGQYAPGRRSAAENRAANQGAASRMTFHASLLYSDCLAPMGLKALSNLRQGVSFETFQKVIGRTAPNIDPITNQPFDIQALYQQFCPEDISQLVGNNDFFIFNGTSQSERNYLAQSLQELVVALMSNPQIAPLLNYDITRLIDEIQFLRGIRNVSRFKRTAPLGAVNGTGAGIGLPGTAPIQANPALQALQTGVSGGA